jgi:membrane-associated phospholipid phosphatase
VRQTDQPVLARIRSEAQRAVVPPGVAQRRGRGFLVAAGVAFTLFVTLLSVVRRNPRLETDVAATMRIQRIRHPLLRRLMHVVSWFGFRPQSLLLPGTAVGGLWLLGLRRDARYLGSAWAASLLSWTTKRFVQRPRPGGDGIEDAVADLRDTSFPSGHALHYVVFWGFFAYLCFTRIRLRGVRWLSTSLIGAIVSLVGPSRVYLGHHWLTDVLGSYSLGTGYLATLIGLHRRGLKDERR